MRILETKNMSFHRYASLEAIITYLADTQLRRKYKEWTQDMTTLSAGERSILGLDKPLKTDLESKSEKRPS